MNRDETAIIKPNPLYTIVAGVDGCGKSSFVGTMIWICLAMSFGRMVLMNEVAIRDLSTENFRIAHHTAAV